MAVQLPLGIRLRDTATFGNFVAGDNAEAVEFLRRGDGESRNVFLWGGRGTGKTHLLQAACHAAADCGTAAYAPLARAGELTPGFLEGLEGLALVCVDDVQAIAGAAEWENGLFHLFNRIRAAGGRLVVAADVPLHAIGLRLPDLVTRLGWGLVFQLKALSDEQKGRAMQLRANARGLELGDNVVRFLLRRYARDTGALFGLLDRLDEASLSTQRRLTIPFVRELLEKE